MGDETIPAPKKTRAPQKDMALEMDVIKKITHQLERLPRGEGAEMRVMAFVQDWASRRPLAGAMPPAPNGQLPLAGKNPFE